MTIPGALLLGTLIALAVIVLGRCFVPRRSANTTFDDGDYEVTTGIFEFEDHESDSDDGDDD